MLYDIQPQFYFAPLPMDVIILPYSHINKTIQKSFQQIITRMIVSPVEQQKVNITIPPDVQETLNRYCGRIFYLKF